MREKSNRIWKKEDWEIFEGGTGGRRLRYMGPQVDVLIPLDRDSLQYTLAISLPMNALGIVEGAITVATFGVIRFGWELRWAMWMLPRLK